MMMKKPMNVLLKLAIILFLIYTLGNYLAELIFDDPETVERVIKMTYIVALIFIPARHFRLKRLYNKSSKK